MDKIPPIDAYLLEQDKLPHILPLSDWEFVAQVATKRVRDKNQSSNSKSKWHQSQPGDRRKLDQKLDDAFIGALGEFLVSQYFGVPWVAEYNQFETWNTNPDLLIGFQRFEVRATEDHHCIVRPPRDVLLRNHGVVMVFVSNIKNDPLYKCEKILNLVPICVQANLELLSPKAAPFYKAPPDLFHCLSNLKNWRES